MIEPVPRRGCADPGAGYAPGVWPARVKLNAKFAGGRLRGDIFRPRQPFGL